jgi:hypothetical protein
MIENCNEQDVALCRPKHATGRHHGVMRAPARRHDLAVTGVVQFKIRVVCMDIGVEQRHIDVLPFSGALPMQQRAGNCRQGMDTGADVTHGRRGDNRGLARLADHRGDAGVCLRDIIEAWQMGQWSGLPQHRD